MTPFLRGLSTVQLLTLLILIAACSPSLNSPFQQANGTFTPVEQGTRSTTSAQSNVPEVNATPELKKEADKVAQSVRAVTTPGSDGYKIGPQDVLEISVFKVPDLTKTVQVSEGGTINLPLVGEVSASGKTSREVEQDLTKKLGSKFLQDPQVNVYVKDYNSQRVTVDGSVKTPGVYPIQGKTTLLQTLAKAQGLSDVADPTVIVFRQIDGQRSIARFDVAQIQKGTAEDPVMVAGDVVVVGNSMMKEGFNNITRVLPFVGSIALLASP